MVHYKKPLEEYYAAVLSPETSLARSIDPWTDRIAEAKASLIKATRKLYECWDAREDVIKTEDILLGEASSEDFVLEVGYRLQKIQAQVTRLKSEDGTPEYNPELLSKKQQEVEMLVDVLAHREVADIRDPENLTVDGCKEARRLIDDVRAQMTNVRRLCESISHHQRQLDTTAFMVKSRAKVTAQDFEKTRIEIEQKFDFVS